MKYYMNHTGNRLSGKNLISKLKSLDKVYITNNICETIHRIFLNILVKIKLVKTHLGIP